MKTDKRTHSLIWGGFVEPKFITYAFVLFLPLMASRASATALSPLAEEVFDMSSSSSSTATTATYTPPSGFGFTNFSLNLGSGFQASKISSGATIFGLLGTASCSVTGTSQVVSSYGNVRSGAFRNLNTPQITSTQETTLYAGATLPSGYRDIPSISSGDMAGSFATYATSFALTRGTSIWSTGVPRVTCGMGIATLAGRILDCDTRHTLKPSWDAVSGDGRLSWDGSQSGNGRGGEGSWTLVNVYSRTLATNGTACDSTCLEVWRDDQTGLLWSDRIGSPTSTVVNTGNFNWCVASGNTQSYTNSTPYTYDCSATGYNTPSISLCSEAPGLVTPLGSAGNTTVAPPSWPYSGNGTGVIDAKAGMTRALNTDTVIANSYSPSVRWRLPTNSDLLQALKDGMQLVLPNFLINPPGLWTSTVWSNNAYRGQAFSLLNAYSFYPQVSVSDRSQTFEVHCVGH